MQGNNFSNIVDSTTVNPFLPPSIKPNILTKVKKLEFINFEDLLNNGPSSRGRRSLRQAVRLVLDESNDSNDDLGSIRAQLSGEVGVVYS